MSDGLDLLERAIGARAQLLVVARAASGREGRAAGWLLTFDVGRIWVASDVAANGLACAHLGSESDAPEPLVPATEEEPWWRVLGSPVVRIAETESGGDAVGALRLQFRGDEDNPRWIALAPEGRGAVAARLAGPTP